MQYKKGDKVYFKGYRCKVLHVLANGKFLILSFADGSWKQFAILSKKAKPIITVYAQVGAIT